MQKGARMKTGYVFSRIGNQIYVISEDENLQSKLNDKVYIYLKDLIMKKLKGEKQ